MSITKLIMTKMKNLDNFNEFWDAESVRRRKLWPARYKSILARHLSTEDIKKQVFSEGPNNVSASVLHRRHICDSNPFISSDDNSSFSEERLRRRLEALGADTRTLSIKTDVRYSAHYKQTYKDVKEIADIHLEEIVVRIKKCYRDDKKDSSNYLVFPYIGRMKHCDNMEYDQDEFNHLDTATLLMEMVADYNLRKEEFLYYSKRQRMDNMCGIVADDITFKLLDDEKLKEKVKRCIEKRFDEERMFREVARSWLIATKKYITLVTEADHDALCPEYGQVRSAIKELDKDSSVFLTERNDLIIDIQGNTCRLEDPYGWKGKKILFHFFSDFPNFTIEFRGICTKALIGYLRQAVGFNKSMMEYLRKARKWYRQLKNMDTEEYSYEVMLPQTNKVIMGANYKYIKKLTIPETATFINDEAFCGLTNLTDITIPQSVCYIGAGAFRNCRQLSNVHLPDILPVIRAETFNGCHHLQKVDFPSTLMSIEEKAFEYCYRLKTANFPASLNIIGSKAFRFCPLLEDLHFSSHTPENISIENNAFDEHVFNTAIVYVPKGCVEAYRANRGFSKFKHICSIG